MKREEIFEFLEIQHNATESELRVRLNEKMKYFSQLLENAPNDFIKKIHEGNIQKLHTVHQALFNSPFVKGNTSPTTSVGRSFIEKNAPLSNPVSNSYHSSPDNDPETQAIAWLISHTENQPTKTYYLHRGRNIIGRKTASPAQGVLAIDDSYISRKHAVIECGNTFWLYDIGELEGKESTNGIFLNANPNRLRKKMALKEGDTIQVGMTKLVFRINHDGNLKEITDEIEQSAYLKTVVIDL
jgi:hypothetical protein